MAQRRSRRSPRAKEEQSLPEYWRGQHESWLSSGLTQAAFCEEHDLSLPSFCWWRWKLKKEDKDVERSRVPAESQGQSLRLVPVRVVDSVVSNSVPVQASTSGNLSSVFEVVLGSGTRIRVPRDFDAEALSRLLRTLDAARC